METHEHVIFQDGCAWCVVDQIRRQKRALFYHQLVEAMLQPIEPYPDEETA